MREENRTKLESLRHVLTGESGSSGEVDEILRIVREEFDPHYTFNLYCSACIMTMVKFAFSSMDAQKK